MLEHPNKIGEVQKVKWYVLEDDRVVSFHTAFLDDSQGGEITFPSEQKVLPSITLRKIIGDQTVRLILNATDDEIERYMKNVALPRVDGIRIKAVIEA